MGECAELGIGSPESTILVQWDGLAVRGGRGSLASFRHGVFVGVCWLSGPQAHTVGAATSTVITREVIRDSARWHSAPVCKRANGGAEYDDAEWEAGSGLFSFRRRVWARRVCDVDVVPGDLAFAGEVGAGRQGRGAAHALDHDAVPRDAPGDVEQLAGIAVGAKIIDRLCTSSASS